MYILTSQKQVVMTGDTIEIGRWENDPTMDTYRIKQGSTYQYAVIKGFEVHQVDSLPEDFEPNKYCYETEKGFYLNPDWIEPEANDIDTVLTELEKEVGINE